MGFSVRQVKALKRNPDHRHIRAREANGRELTYLEGWYAIPDGELNIRLSRRNSRFNALVDAQNASNACLARLPLAQHINPAAILIHRSLVLAH
jgi:hypothetical protein